MAKLLEVKNLATEFSTQDGVVRAVDGISYDLNEGEIIGIVGESGCGKTVSALSVMRLIASPPGKIVGGEVIFDGKDLLKLSGAQMRRVRGNRISMIFQEPMTSLNPVLTIGRQLTETLQLHLRMNKTDSHQRARELLDMVGIPDAERLLNDYPHQLSGGMSQRVMIAMAISCNPRLILADEPTTALDVTIQAQVIELISDLRKELGMAAILITHDLALVAGFCEEIVVMYGGFIVERAPARDVFYTPKHPYTMGLLESMPSISAARGDRLSAIPGAPPDMTNLPVGCPFAERCRYVKDKCIEEMPPVEMIGDGRTIRCWVDVDTGELR